MLFGFFTPGPMELAVIGIVAVLLFGHRLPKVARGLGSSLIEFKRGLTGIDTEIKEVGDEFTDAARETNKVIKG